MTPGTKAAVAKMYKIAFGKVDLEKPTAKGFELTVDSFGEAAEPPTTGLRKTLGAALVPLGADQTGGVYAEWLAKKNESPVVYFGTEGNLEIAASGTDEFLGTLAHCAGDGWRAKDAMAYWRRALTTLDADKVAEPAFFASPGAEVDADVAAVLGAHDIAVVPDVMASVEAANRKYLWAFIDAIDVLVSGHKAFHTWFDAWNRDDASGIRAFSPNEHYEPGERVTYISKRQSGETRGKGVVLANPRPNRVLLADGSNTFLRACATS